MNPWEMDWSTRADATTAAPPPAKPWEMDWSKPPPTAASEAQARLAKPSTAEDVVKSAAVGLERGIAAAPMIVPNLINGMFAGPQLLAVGVKDTIEGNPTTQNPHIWQPFYSSEDVLQAAPAALRPHDPQTPAGVATDIAGQFLGGIAGTKAIQAAPAAGKLLSNQASGAPAKPTPVTADDIRAQARAAYTDAETKGGTLTPTVTNSFLDDAANILPQTPAGKLVLGDTPTTKLVERLQGLRDQPLTLAEAQEIDAGLTDAMSGHLDPRSGRLLADGLKLQKIQTTLRDAIENAPASAVTGGKDGFDALQNARSLWSQSARLGDIESIITRAEMADNPATAIKTGFRTLYNNPGRMRGFTGDEAALIKTAAETGVAGDMLRTFGSRLIPIVAAGSGGGLGGTAAAEALSLASRGAATKLQVGRAAKVADAVANRGVQPPPPPNVQPPVNTGSTPALAAGSGGIGAQLAAPDEEAPPPAPTAPTVALPPPPEPMSPDAQAPVPLLDKIARTESNNNPAARNPNSTASGRFQFTDDTWAQAVAKFGPALGVTLADKTSDAAQEKMALALAKDNAQILNNTLGRMPTKGELYIAHFLGAGDATKLIRAQGTGRDAATVLPNAVIRANRSIFFDKGRPRTVEQVYSLLQQKVA